MRGPGWGLVSHFTPNFKLGPLYYNHAWYPVFWFFWTYHISNGIVISVIIRIMFAFPPLLGILWGWIPGTFSHFHILKAHPAQSLALKNLVTMNTQSEATFQTSVLLQTTMTVRSGTSGPISPSFCFPIWKEEIKIHTLKALNDIKHKNAAQRLAKSKY